MIRFAPANGKFFLGICETFFWIARLTLPANFFAAASAKKRGEKPQNVVAVENFAQIEESNKLVILGDMLELGTDSEKEHADIVHLVQTNNIPAIFVGKEFEKIDSLSLHFSDVESCIEYLKDEHITNSFILIKGSHGIHLEKIIEYL